MRTHTLLTASPARPTLRPVALPLFVLAATLALVVLAGCVPVSPEGGPATGLTATTSALPYADVVESVAGYTMPALPTPAPTPEVQTQVIVSTGGARANVRSGPATNAEIVGKAENGTALDVIGRSADEAWWQVSFDGAEGWISDSIVRVAGPGDEVPVATGDGSSEPLFDESLQAAWDIDWSCTSDEGRCTVDACDASVTAGVQRQGDGQFIPVEYAVEWSDDCWAQDSWVFEVSPLTGLERTGEYLDNFLYSYWQGAGTGSISGVFPFGNDQGIVVSCAGPDTVEIEEGDGWTSSYEGITCHDQRTGMLVYMKYTKRWLFTGEFEGKNYERAYFGDTETLEQRLVDTNAELLFVEER